MYLSKNGIEWTGPVDCGTNFSGYPPCIDCGTDDVLWAVMIENQQQVIYKGTPTKDTTPYTYTFESITLSTHNEYYGNITVNQSDPHYIIAGFRSKCHISRDGGDTWDAVTVGGPSSVSIMLWVNENKIIALNYNYNYDIHDLLVYSIDYTTQWDVTLMGTIDNVNYCANSDADIDDDGNIYCLYMNQGIVTVRRFHHSDFSTYVEKTFTTVDNIYRFDSGILMQRKSGEFITATYSNTDAKLHFYYTNNGFETVVDLDTAISSSVSVTNFAHHRIDDSIITILYLSGGNTYSIRWFYDDIIKINSNKTTANELIENENMVAGSVGFDCMSEGEHQPAYIETTSPVGNTLSTNFTIEWWVYHIDGYRYQVTGEYSNTYAGIFNAFGGTTCYIGINPYNTYGNLVYYLNLTGSLPFYSVSLPYSSKNRWSHFAITYDGTNVKSYMDGVLINTENRPGHLRTGTAKMRIGYFTTYWLIGYLSDIRIWNITRTGTEIITDMNRRLRGDETGLIFYMPLNDGTGSTSRDVVGSNNGTLVNTSWLMDNPPQSVVKFTNMHEIIAPEFVEDVSETKPLRITPSNILSCDLREHYFI